MALEHEAYDGLVALRNLFTHILCHGRLQGWILVGVGVTAVDHDVGIETRGLEGSFTPSYVQRCNSAPTTAPKYDVPITIATGFKDRDLAIRIDTQKAMRIGD